MDKVGGRRFLLCALAIFFVFALVLVGKVSDDIFRDVVIGVIGAYVLGNTGQKVFENVKASANGFESTPNNSSSRELPLYNGTGLQARAETEGRSNNYTSRAASETGQSTG